MTITFSCRFLNLAAFGLSSNLGTCLILIRPPNMIVMTPISTTVQRQASDDGHKGFVYCVWSRWSFLFQTHILSRFLGFDVRYRYQTLNVWTLKQFAAECFVSQNAHIDLWHLDYIPPWSNSKWWANLDSRCQGWYSLFFQFKFRLVMGNWTSFTFYANILRRTFKWKFSLIAKILWLLCS